MTRHTLTVLVAALVALGPQDVLLAQRGSRGSVSGASRSRSGTTASRSGATGSRDVSQTSDGYNSSRQAQTRSGGSKSVERSVDTDERSVETTSTTTTAWGESATRTREVEGQGGHATIEGSGSTSTGREASGEGVAGRNAYGQPTVAGSVNTKYHGSYAGAATRNPGGGYTSATVGPYGGKVTTTLPSGYRTTTYHGRSYYAYGGAYYRPYTHGGVHYYYPVPPPYYSYYSSPPVGAMVLMVAGVAYLMSQDGSYSTQTTNSDGKVAYQAVPAPQGAQIKTLPAARVLVTVSGVTYYLCSNTFYRRVVDGAQESFVVVTAPAGTVFVPALPADFEVVQLNAMYFKTEGQFYVPFLAADGKELYVKVDPPPAPSAATPAPAATKPAASALAAAPVRAVAESIVIPTGTLLVVRLSTEVSSASATVGDRFQGFLDLDLAADGRLIAPKGTRVYGAVTAVERGSKMKGQPELSATITDMKVGDRVLSVKTQPLTVKGTAATGGMKVAGGVAVIAAQSAASFTLAVPLQVDLMTNVAVR